MRLPQTRSQTMKTKYLFGSAAASTVTRYAGYGSGANARKQDSLADIRHRGPRGRGSALERCLYDRPRPEPMRRAYVGLRKPRLCRAIQECVLTLTGAVSRPSEGVLRCKFGDILRKKIARVATGLMNETVVVAAQVQLRLGIPRHAKSYRSAKA